MTRIVRAAATSTNTTTIAMTMRAAIERVSFLVAFLPKSVPLRQPAAEAAADRVRQGPRSEVHPHRDHATLGRPQACSARVLTGRGSHSIHDRQGRRLVKRPSAASVHDERGGAPYLDHLDALARIDHLSFVVAARGPHLAAVDLHAAHALVVCDPLEHDRGPPH